MKKIIISLSFFVIIFLVFAFKKPSSQKNKIAKTTTNWIYLTYRSNNYGYSAVKTRANWVEDMYYNPETACPTSNEIPCAIHVPEEYLVGSWPNRTPGNSIIINAIHYYSIYYYAGWGYGTAPFDIYNTVAP